MKPLFFGVDVAGSDNTWAAGLVPRGSGFSLASGPGVLSLSDVVSTIERMGATSVAIDGQLSLAVSDEKGFRSSDIELRERLPADCRNWVASVNSLMAVPVRAQLLAERLSPVVGTILETHPRATLFLELGEAFLPDIKEYKRSSEAVRRLAEAWANCHGIAGCAVQHADGALDALVCATVAGYFHRAPERLLFLKHNAADRRGRGPFVVGMRATDA